MSNSSPSIDDVVGSAHNGPVIHSDDGTTSPIRIDKTQQPEPSEQTAAAVDQRLVEETQQQIRILVSEIVELSKRNISETEFYEGFTARCVTALSSIGGAVWLKERNSLSLEHQINLAKTDLATEGPSAFQHDRLLKRLFAAGEATTVLPATINTSDDSGNPTTSLLVVAPIKVDGQTHGLIEIFQRPNAGPVTQRGYLRFLMQMAEIAGDFHKNRRLRQLDERQNLWSRLDQFLNCIHQSLDIKETAYSLANEGRRLIQCDRLSVTLTEGSRLRVAATSGIDIVQRRADQIKLMEKLATVVCRTKQPLYYTGPTEDLAPQIENCLQAYLDISHCKAVAIVPLTQSPKAESSDQQDGKPKSKPHVKKTFIGALVIEQLGDERISEDKSNRIELVAQHGSAALANANQHSNLFLLPLWKFLGKLSWFTNATNLPKTLIATTVLVLCIFTLIAVPYQFAMPAKGVIQPVTRHEIYTQVPGLIDDIPLPNQQNVLVNANQLLVKMKNPDFQSELEILRGKIVETMNLHHEANQRYGEASDRIEKLKIQSEINEAAMNYNSMQARAAILEQKLKLLSIDSPIAGQVINWNVRQSLRGRPVLAGERLMTIVDLKGPWEIELYLPERGASHVLDYDRLQEDPLKVEFELASHPGQTFIGEVTEIDRRAELHEPHGHSLRVIVRFDYNELAEALRRPGTRVTAKIICGKKPLGFVLFREVWETVQSQVLFWF